VKTTEQQRLTLTGWGIPLAYVSATVIVGMAFPRVEHHFLPHWAMGVSAQSAIAICSSIASGMIALTGVVFSLAFVMVQFSATAYSPRLVLWVARDPVLSHALGMFSSTFLYALIMLSWVDREGEGRVPWASSWVVMLLLLGSIGMFIALIHRIGRLQVNRMLIFTGDQGRKAVLDLYPLPETGAAADAPVDWGNTPVTQTVTHFGRPQVIQTVNVPHLVQLAHQAGAVIAVTAAVGDTVLELSPLLRVYGAREPVEEAQLRRGFEISDERTFEQDPKYAMRLVVDIAIKALSPAINDPTTAVQALDQIEDLLIRLGQRQLDIGNYRDAAGTLRLVVPFPTWDDFLRLGLDEIRHYGAGSVQVMRRMTALIQNLQAILPPVRHAALHKWEKRLEGTVQRSFSDRAEKQDASVADRQGLGIGEEQPE